MSNLTVKFGKISRLDLTKNDKKHKNTTKMSMNKKIIYCILLI